MDIYGGKAIMTTKTEELWQLLHDGLRAFIAKRVNDQVHVDDILQDVFVRVHLQVDRVNDPGRLVSWIYQVSVGGRGILSPLLRADQPGLCVARRRRTSAVAAGSGHALDDAQSSRNGLHDRLCRISGGHRYSGVTEHPRMKRETRALAINSVQTTPNNK
ncbi:MAG: hypothetical protein HP491_04585 [Nitrospira sp.]|nr:hypothetical protein [Nitrospira sp.]